MCNPNDLILDDLAATDWLALVPIYRQGIATGVATFEDSPPPSWDAWSAGKLGCCRMAARWQDELVGWAALSLVSSRKVYQGVAEVSIYVAEGHRGRGIGISLLKGLLASSETAGIWTLQAGIIAKNITSIALHQAAGFRLVGIREKLGFMTYGPYAGQWLDVALLERRSSMVLTL